MASINVRDGTIATRHTAGFQILETRPSNNNAIRAEFFSNRPVLPWYNRLGEEVKRSRTNLDMMNQLLYQHANNWELPRKKLIMKLYS